MFFIFVSVSCKLSIWFYTNTCLWILLSDAALKDSSYQSFFITPDGSTKTRKNRAVKMKNTHNYRRKIKRKNNKIKIRIH